ncbi:UNVERIFIED_CONTAM: hypothetical protein Sindi_1310200, partial [Sesamum indicum]
YREVLNTVASGVGKPLYPDAITRACMRLDFARGCVMLDITQKLRKHIIIMTPDEDGGEAPCKVDVEYEWHPPKCTDCMTLGHTAKDCSLNKSNKPTKPPVAVYVPKINTPRPPPEPVWEKERLPNPAHEVVDRSKESNVPNEHNVPNHEDRSKAVFIYNAFDALHLLDDTDEPSRDPNT